MKTILTQALLIISGLFCVTQVPGQTEESGIDSVAIIQPKAGKNLYRFNDNGAKEIQFSNKNPKLVKKQTNAGLRNATNGIMTVMTGIGFNSVAGENWEIAGTVLCNDTLPDWSVNLYCEGYETTDRQRVRNDDDSWSVQTNENRFYYWDRNAYGILIEAGDTIGSFLIILNPQKDTMLNSWTPYIFPQNEGSQNASFKTKGFFKGMPSPYKDFATSGKFREKNFIMIRNGNDHKVWVYYDNVLSCLFELDLQNPAISKKNYLLSYIIINKNVISPDSRDLVRLAMVNRLVNNSLNLH